MILRTNSKSIFHSQRARFRVSTQFYSLFNPFNFHHQTRKGIRDYHHRNYTLFPQIRSTWHLLITGIPIAIPSQTDIRPPKAELPPIRNSIKSARSSDERSNFTSGKRDIIMSRTLAGFQMVVWKWELHSGMTLLMKVTAGVQDFRSSSSGCRYAGRVTGNRCCWRILVAVFSYYLHLILMLQRKM